MGAFNDLCLLKYFTSDWSVPVSLLWTEPDYTGKFLPLLAGSLPAVKRVLILPMNQYA
jgi:hypothetical protein